MCAEHSTSSKLNALSLAKYSLSSRSLCVGNVNLYLAFLRFSLIGVDYFKVIAIACTKNVKRFIFVNQAGVDGGDGEGMKKKKQPVKFSLPVRWQWSLYSY